MVETMDQTISTSLADECRVAIASLERARAAPPSQFIDESTAALRSAVLVRDALIARLPAGDSAGRAALDQVNLALSLIVSLVYPAAGLIRENIDPARGALQSLLALLE